MTNNLIGKLWICPFCKNGFTFFMENGLSDHLYLSHEKELKAE